MEYYKYIKYKTKYLDIKNNRKDNYLHLVGGEKYTVSNDKIEKIINKKFQNLLNTYNEYHIFFNSYKWFVESVEEWETENTIDTQEYIKYNDPDGKYYGYDNNIQIDNINPIDTCTYIPKQILSVEQLKKNYEMVSDKEINDFNKIENIVDEMFDYNLPSSIDNIKTYLNKVKNDTVTNIIVVGAGPVGLYTALYLDMYYNKNNLYQRVNILLIDNRIVTEGVKLPYSRVTEFGFDITQFQQFIPQITCWNNKIMSNRQFGPIYILENLLYLRAFHQQIPMYFTKKYETFDKLKKMAVKYNFNYILDCTGGRLGAKLEGNVKWDNLKFKKDNCEVKYVGNNMYKFFVDDIEYEKYTIVLTLYDKNNKPLPTGNFFSNNDNEDKLIIQQHNNKCYRKDDYVKISRHFKNDNLRYRYPTLLKATGIDEKLVEYVKLTTFNSNSHHVNKVAMVLNNNLTYIGLGDTLGSSEYGIFFGMQGGIAFSRYVCHVIGLSSI